MPVESKLSSPRHNAPLPVNQIHTIAKKEWHKKHGEGRPCSPRTIQHQTFACQAPTNSRGGKSNIIPFDCEWSQNKELRSRSRMAGSGWTWGRGETRRIYRMVLVLLLLRLDLDLTWLLRVLQARATILIQEEANLGWIGKRRMHANESTLQKGSLFIEAESSCGSSR
jgi:hypothetical protein